MLAPLHSELIPPEFLNLELLPSEGESEPGKSSARMPLNQFSPGNSHDRHQRQRSSREVH
jgi:hypothetical protein